MKPAALKIAAALLAATTLAGCKTTDPTHSRMVDSTFPTDYRQRHPITIAEADKAMEVFVGNNRGGLSPSQRTEVMAFAGGWREEGTSGFVIAVPAGAPNELAAHDAARAIHSALVARGVPAHAISTRAYRPVDSTRLATVRVSFTRLEADAGPCGLWPDDLGTTPAGTSFHNRPYWNLGCATQRNLAAMVANPADLVQPRAETPTYAGRRSVAIDKWRKGESPSTVYPDSSEGKISEVGN
jgi:pilus assembly protein CpaD